MQLAVAALLSDYNADVIIGCETHVDHLFLLSEILRTVYKIIRQDHYLGGSGVFIYWIQRSSQCL